MKRLGEWQGHTVTEWQSLLRSGDIAFFESTPSTNDVVTRMAQAGAPDLSFALAEEQTSGRGRGGSSWQAPSGSALLFSVLFRVPQTGDAPGCASLRIGVAVAQAIAEVSGASARMKWPNDVVIEDCGKVAGILCEGVFGHSGGAHIVAGIGINVLQRPADFPEPLRGQAGSILMATETEVDRGELLRAIFLRLGAIAPRLTHRLSGDELAQVSALDVLRGQRIVCDTGSEKLTGEERGVATDGALLMDVQGTMRALYNGTVRIAQSHSYPGSVI